jgi:hypothetical protein
LYVVPDVAPDPLLLKVTEFDTLFAVQLVHVPVRLVMTPEAGVPRAGVTKVGLVARTTLPLPVELVRVGACAADPVPVLVTKFGVVVVLPDRNAVAPAPD